MRKNQTNIFLTTLNTILLVVFVFLGIVFFIITIEDNKDRGQIESYILKENKKEKTMFKNELPKTIKKEKIKTIESNLEDDFKEKDPELAYAEKLFEKSVNSKLRTVFNKPFNYKKDNYCMLEVQMSLNFYKIKNCNSDNIFKREIEIGIGKMKPFKRKTYNNKNLNNKKITIKLKIK